MKGKIKAVRRSGKYWAARRLIQQCGKEKGRWFKMKVVYILKEDVAHTELYDKEDDIRGKVLGVYATEEAARREMDLCVADVVREYSDEGGVYIAEVVSRKTYDSRLDTFSFPIRVSAVVVNINERAYPAHTDREMLYSIERHIVQ